MKKGEFETAESLHKKWEDYCSRHDVSKDVEALIKLVEGNTGIARNEAEVLATVYDSALVVLDSSFLDEEDKTRASYFSYSLYTSDTSQKDCGACIDKKGQIRIGHSFFLETLNQKASPAFGVLELMFTLLYEMLQGIFPELDEKAITEKTQQVWESGMSATAREKEAGVSLE